MCRIWVKRVIGDWREEASVRIFWKANCLTVAVTLVTPAGRGPLILDRAVSHLHTDRDEPSLYRKTSISMTTCHVTGKVEHHTEGDFAEIPL